MKIHLLGKNGLAPVVEVIAQDCHRQDSCCDLSADNS